MKITHLTAGFDGKTVLRDLSLDIPEGKTTCILGPSGCGKTTLLRCIAGLLRPEAGQIEGVPEKTAFLFQEDRLAEDYSAVSNLRLVTGRKVPRERIEALLRALELTEYRQPVREFSGGMKRRVAIARTLIYGADLILMDEPFKGLDESLRKKTMQIVRESLRDRTVILVTHDPEEAEFMGDRSVLLTEHMAKETA